MKQVITFSLIGLFVLCLGLSGQAQAIWVEDFKDPGDGFDQTWSAAAMTLGSGTPTVTSNHEIGTLAIDSDPWAAAVTQTATFAWDTATNQYAQIMVPNLPFGERVKVFGYTSTNGFAAPILLHNEWLEIPGQGNRPQLLDITSVLPTSGAQDILIRLELIDQPYGDPPEFEIDWLKAGMPASASPAPGLCGFVGPASGVESANPPTFEWTAPSGYTGNTYTLTYGMEPASATTPLFSDDTTVTVLDGVTGTSYTPLAPPLAEGNWYWTVSATNTGGLSGPFVEATAPIGDSRDPLSRQYYWFSVIASSVSDWHQY